MNLLIKVFVVSTVLTSVFCLQIDFNKKVNSKVHKTDKFYDSTDALVVRRRSPVSITISGVKEPLSLKVDHYREDGSLVLPESTDETSFEVNTLVAQTGIEITYHNFPIGKFKLVIELYNQDGTVRLYGKSTWIYILFNPWSSLEPVYMKNNVDLEEYVLSDSAVMFFGTKYSRPWVFGQYEKGVLDIVFKVLNRTNLNSQRWFNWQNPVVISREVSAIANNHTKNGLIEGRWTRDFSGGTNPLDWSSSVQILTQYNRTGLPVKYGQCWVFSGVVTTILRAIGIPTRPITTDFAGVDITRDILLDKCLDENGNVIKDGKFCGLDRRWNYHIWNEVWMQRKDIDSKYHSVRGWQVVDGTPAVVNDGQYKIGPAPVKAVKSGESNINYETDFVFAEVGAPVVAWLVDKTGKRVKVLSVDYSKTGEKIVTKKVGSNDQVDIKSNYKHVTSYFQRLALIKALINHGTDPAIIDYDERKNKSVLFTSVVVSQVNLGGDIIVKVIMASTTKKAEKVHLKIVVESIDDLEDPWLKITEKKFDVTVGPTKQKIVSFKVPASLYADKLNNRQGVAVNFIGYVENKDQIWGTREILTVVNPKMNVTLTSNLNGNKSVRVAFNNPLDINLNNCKLAVSKVSSIEHISVGSIKATGRFEKELTESDEKIVAAILSCDEVKGIVASLMD